MKKYYPIMIDLEDKCCTIIGGGKVAERKAISLLEYKAKVRIVGPRLTSILAKLAEDKQILWVSRPYQWGDLDNSCLVYVATNDSDVNRLCYQEARQRGVPINIVDSPHLCDFIVPASIQRGDLSVMVSTNGKSPMLSRRIREELEKRYGQEYEEFVDLLGELRERVLNEIEDIEKRRQIFEAVVYSDILQQHSEGESKSLREKIEEIYKRMR
ncbi:precorrin-2 dehydrogenase [Geosporobacter subterraneus DSM 17957]|uniref:precorrin-2 dehydrogenase n=1 Tax=Geosporobacter subterraneus DSM 17957 TaxID=1121919 RepID=A0A1M6G413_9FIRM|nr:bifunctional precorrin-2 dehydrogenase/sirohydrochlorin ferrochelatase [Geosporobacter subterraneus]SHJ04716.1 precorrin-2 dehydrogenase [Geosporobacter subterraneus DSM 17957]